MNYLVKRNFQILFRDSSEYFEVKNARMFNESNLIRFEVFESDKWKETIYYPLCNIYRIKVGLNESPTKPNLKVPEGPPIVTRREKK